jgi:exopolysaccharide biosynthesis protein
MIAIGAYTALNVDGGGSTTMVRMDKNGKVEILNRPSAGTARFDASALGVFANPLPR